MGNRKNKDDIAASVDDVLTRAVGTFVDPGGSFKKKLIAKAIGEYEGEIVVKLGVDPTRPDIHLGHAVALRKLRALQDLGCKVIFLVGDFTALIGDPTGKSKVRPELSQKEIFGNMQTYLDQIGRILRVEHDNMGNIVDSASFSWMRNSDWFFGVTDISPEGASKSALVANIDGKKINIPLAENSFVSKAVVYENTRMQKTALDRRETHSVSLMNALAVLRNVSYAQLLERDLFQERLKGNEPLYMHEMLYPVFQGIDSVVLANIYGSCDLEIGGTDQTFNMLMGRKVMEIAHKEPQAVLAVDILVGLDGKEKMSKSLDNYIGVTDPPSDMYGKLMSIPDGVISAYMTLCTFTPREEISQIEKKLKAGKVNPRDIKMSLARQVVEIYHGQARAKEAEERFVATFQNKQLPSEMTKITADKGALLADILLAAKMIDSKSEFRRLMNEGAIRRDGEEKLSDPTMKITNDIVLRIGKHRFVRIVVKE